MSEQQGVVLAGAEGNRLAGDLHDGGGRPVLFLHGGGQTRHAWKATARSVAARGMKAVSIDMRGHGDSDWSQDGNYALADYAADVATVADTLRRQHGDRPAVVGASLGGLAALLAEARSPGILGSLVLVDVTPRMNLDGIARVQGFMGARLEEGFASLEEAADAIAAYLPDRRRPRSLEGLRKNLRLAPDGRFRWHWDPKFIRGERNVNHDGMKLMEEMLDALPRLDLPVLLVRGMQSELVQEDHAREFVRMAPNARYVDVGGAGHMVAGDRNDVFRNAVIDFLSTLQPA